MSRTQKKLQTSGEIKFDGYATKYRPELPCVLENFNLDVSDNEKVETPMLMTWQWTGQLMCDNYNDGKVDDNDEKIRKFSGGVSGADNDNDTDKEMIRKFSGGDRGANRSREVESQPRSLQDD